MSLWAVDSDPWESTEKRLMLAIPGCTCSWATKTGGCYHCRVGTGGVSARGAGYESTDALFGRARWLDDFIVVAEAARPSTVCLYVPGSFFGSADLPRSLRLALIESVARLPIKRIVVESLPSAIDERSLAECLEKLAGKQLVVALGLDIADDYLRWACLHKPGSAAQFRSACKLLADRDVLALAYVSLKPPFLNESEAIRVAIDTALYALECGTAAISLEPVAVVPGTFLQDLAELGMYTPPWIWSAGTVRKALPQDARVFLGEFYYPKPVYGVRGCNTCKESVRTMFGDHLESRQVGSTRCRCSNIWAQEVRKSPIADSIHASVRARHGRARTYLAHHLPLIQRQRLP